MSSDGTTSTVGFWVGLALGAPLMAVGGAGLLREHRVTHPPEAVRWIVGAAVVHDGLLVPAVLVVGAVTARLVSARLRPWVQAALVAAAPVALFAWPFVRGYGRLGNNPSILPRNYARGLLLTLTALWLAVALVAVAARRRRPR